MSSTNNNNPNHTLPLTEVKISCLMPRAQWGMDDRRSFHDPVCLIRAPKHDPNDCNAFTTGHPQLHVIGNGRGTFYN